MKPKQLSTNQDDLFKSRLTNQLNPKHRLVKLSHQINWSSFENEFRSLFKEDSLGGQPPKPVRLIIGLLMLQHMFDLSDEEVVDAWVQNPYWQYFCGYDFLQWDLPADSTTLVRWRKRLGEEGLDTILSETIQVSLRTKMVKERDLKEVIADTTVMEKNIRYPTDSHLLNKAREKLVQLAKQSDLSLRQSYAFVGKRCAHKVSRYAHAKQWGRTKKELRKLKTYLGRTVRDIGRQLPESSDLEAVFTPLIDLSNRLLSQTKKSHNKVYSLHEPAVYCIAKGKTGKPYEFGCKVSLVTTLKQGLSISLRSLETAAYDGHSLDSSLSHAEAITGYSIKRSFVDKGYRGHGIEGRDVYISGQKRGMTASLKRKLKRRSSIEPHIGHMKNDGRLRRNFLKGVKGDQLNARLCAIGHNLRLILNHIEGSFALIIKMVIKSIKMTLSPYKLILQN